MTKQARSPGRVCIEASPAVQQQAGLGRYTAGLLRGLQAVSPQGDYAVAYNRAGAEGLPPEINSLPAYRFNLGNKPWRLRNAVTYFGAPPMDGALPGVALYHSTGHLLPRLRRIRTVFTLHDLIPLLFPEYHLPLNRLFLRVMFPRFLRSADAIIAVSEQTRRDANRLLNIAPDRITVIPEAPDPQFQPVGDPRALAAVRAKFSLPETFILYLATIEPRKNHTLLLEVYRELRKRRPGVPLVLAGAPGWLFKDFFAALADSGLHRQVILTGHVDEVDLPALLSAATVFVCPSLHEGFGLPPLEAMACGTAVVCSNRSSLPEAVGDAGILLDPDDIRGWVTAMDQVLSNAAFRRELEAHGRAHAARFTWEATAGATRAVYDRLLDE
ncbi:MAG: glycosyltransferase family 4 protein [Anaerolineales bacterium]